MIKRQIQKLMTCLKYCLSWRRSKIKKAMESFL